MNDRRLRVMHVLKSSSYSGAENVAITIIKGLSDRLDLLYVSGDGPIRQTLDQESIPYRLLDRVDLRSLKSVIAEYDPDIIHAHDFTASVLCSLAGGRYRLLSHIHNDPPWIRTWNPRTIAFAMCRRRIHKVLIVSEGMLERTVFASAYKDVTEAIGNPVNAEKVRRLAMEKERDFGEVFSESLACDILFVGRLAEQKDPCRFIRLVAKLKERGQKTIRAMVVGDGPLCGECRELVEKLGLQSQILMKGFQTNPYPYIANAGILCITSRWEGFGLVAVEANLLGVPVLTTVTSGSLAIFGEEAEELCRTDDDFLEQIEKFYNCPEIYRSWRERSLQQAEKWINQKDYMERLYLLYIQKG